MQENTSPGSPVHGSTLASIGAVWALLAIVVIGSSADVLRAQNIPTPTLGGAQFWSDHLVHGAWRIQQHAVTGHFRLLDEKNIRRAWGNYQHCRDQFQTFRREKELAQLKPTAVVVVHGLGRTRNAMKGLAGFLEKESDWSIVNFSYASTRKSVADHATCLDCVLSNLDGVKKVHFVGHSLGNIVIRKYLAERKKQPAIGRVVMLAPPNHGSAVARLLKKNKLFEWIGGESGQDLGPTWETLKPQLATPHEFAIIAGSTRSGKGSNPLIPGDDDLVVGVQETRLIGATDFLVVDSVHTYVMDKDEVQEKTLKYLQHGYFHSASQLNPVFADESDATP